MITKPLPVCQSETILKMFDDNYKSEVPKCSCCFACIQSHSEGGCLTCSNFFKKFFPETRINKVTKSLAIELKEAMSDLFCALDMKKVMIEKSMEVTSISFTKDFIKNIDEVKTEEDIIRIWHIEPLLAKKIYLLLNDVINGAADVNVNFSSEEESEASDEDSDVFDDSTDDNS